MKKTILVFLIAITPVTAVGVYSLATHRAVNAPSNDGPLYRSREKLILSRDKATGQVSGNVERGHIAVAFVNLWTRQDIQHAGALYTPVATITETEPVILFSHCDLPYRFAIEDGKLIVSGSCNQANWNEAPIDVVVLYSR